MACVNILKSRTSAAAYKTWAKSVLRELDLVGFPETDLVFHEDELRQLGFIDGCEAHQLSIVGDATCYQQAYKMLALGTRTRRGVAIDFRVAVFVRSSSTCAFLHFDSTPYLTIECQRTRRALVGHDGAVLDCMSYMRTGVDRRGGFTTRRQGAAGRQKSTGLAILFRTKWIRGNWTPREGVVAFIVCFFSWHSCELPSGGGMAVEGNVSAPYEHYNYASGSLYAETQHHQIVVLRHGCWCECLREYADCLSY